MRRALSLLALGAAIAATLPAAAALKPSQGDPGGHAPGKASLSKPVRIMSVNQCADLLLLQLVPRDRIASISYVSREDVAELLPGADAGVAVNRGAAEDIVAQKPDLILAGDFTTPTTRRFAARVGARVVEVPGATTFEQTRDVIRQVGAAVGEPARAEALIARMDADLALLAASRPAKPVRAVAWSGGITVPGQRTLANAIFTAAGAVNIAAEPGGAYSGYDVERMLRARPDVLLYVGTTDLQPSMQAQEGRHRLLLRRYGPRQIAYSEAAYSCGLPQSAAAAVALRRQLEALQ